MNNTLQKNLSNFLSNYNAFKNKYIQILSENNIEKNPNDGFYYITTPNGKNIKYTWNNIKDTHNEDLLIKINKIRKGFVDELIKIIEESKENYCSRKTNTFSYCEIQALGSTALTSNYDVNISSFLAASNMVYLFNNYFYNFWNDTSGEIFDTNLYGNSFFISTFKNDKLDGKYNHFSVGNSQKTTYYIPPATINELLLREILSQQTKWIIIKTYLYRDEIGNRGNVEGIFERVRGIVLRIIEKLVGGGNRIGGYREKYEAMKMENNGIPANQFRFDVNKKYYECLLKSDANVKAYIESSGNRESECLKNLIESISFSNFYGNETYFCLGTIYHVLGYIQGLGPFHMYPEYFLQSMLENFIDVFRYVGYMNKEEGLFKMSKYIYRVYDAIGRYYGLMGRNYGNGKKNLFKEMLNAYKAKKNSVRLDNYNLGSLYGVENRSARVILENILNDIEKVVEEYVS